VRTAGEKGIPEEEAWEEENGDILHWEKWWEIGGRREPQRVPGRW